MTKKTIYLTFFLSFTFALSSQGQEIVTGLLNNKSVKDARQHQKISVLKSKSSNDTLTLPFFDDFIPDSVFPSSYRWTDEDVFINNTYPVNQISQGVATFDAIDSNGLLYDEAGTIGFEADHLTSSPIDLDIDASENIFLSFFYQPQGIADPPETKDSLVLQFFSITENDWKHIWKAEGTELHNFKPVIIKIDDPEYLYRGFRFRFINYASISSTISDPALAGNSDHWNIDYVYLDSNRSPSDTIPEDVAFTNPVRSVLNTYESMPWEQFRDVFLFEMGSFININYRNNDQVTRNVTRNFTIWDEYEDSQAHSFSAGATNIDPGEWVSYDANLIYTFNSSFNDSALFRVRSVLITDEFDPKVNDTIDYYQIFSNYFAYDDGSAENGYGINGQGASNAKVSTRFRTYQPDTLRAILIAFNDSYLSSNQRYFNIAVWNDDNGMPGDLIYEQEELVDPGMTVNGFVEYILDDPVIVNDYFHIGWTQLSETFLNVGMDMNTLPEGRRHYFINGEWNESEIPGSLLIRPVIGRSLITGIDEISENTEPGKLSIWPNPADDILNIEIPENIRTGDITINIYDSNGRWMLSERQTTTVNISSLPSGVYIIRIKDENRIIGYNRFIRL